MFQQHGQLPKRWGTLSLLASDVRLPPTDQEDWWHSDVDRFGHQLLYESGNDVDTILRRSRSMMVVFGVLLGTVAFFWSSYLFGRCGGCILFAFFPFSPPLLAHGRPLTSGLAAPCF